jgi:hypothetical protein
MHLVDMVYTGPRGGKYVMVNGKRRYVTSGKNTRERNTLGRAIYVGSRGKLFVITSGGGKSYKFTRVTATNRVRSPVNNIVPRRALLISQIPNIVPIVPRRNANSNSRIKKLLKYK